MPLQKCAMTRLTAIVFVGTYFLLLSACDDNDLPPTVPDEDIDLTIGVICEPDTGMVLMPLAAGNYWLMEIQAYNDSLFRWADTAKSVITELYAGAYIDSAYCTGVEEYYYNYRDEQPDHRQFLYRNGADGLYKMGEMTTDDTLIAPRFLHKYPVEVGDNWSNSEISGLASPGLASNAKPTVTNYRCVAIDEPFNTPLGTYSCIVYAASYSLGDDVLQWSHYFFYFVPGIGPVGVETYYASGTTYSWDNRQIRELKRRKELIEYQVSNE